MPSINNISKSFQGKKILDDITIEIKKNSILGLAGQSGGGKSTLLRCIQGLESIDSGSIEIEGESGFMFQDFQLFPHMNVIQNLTYAPNLRDRNTNHEGFAVTMLNDLGVGDKINAFPSELSGGQKQRVALARALMMSPQLLLCDEPTSGLDVATIEDVVSLLKVARITMIIASHDLDFLTKIADRIIVLKDGKISLDVNPEEIESPTQYLRQYY